MQNMHGTEGHGIDMRGFAVLKGLSREEETEVDSADSA